MSTRRRIAGTIAPALLAAILGFSKAPATSGELYPYPDLLKRDMQEWEEYLEPNRSEPKNGPPLANDPVVTSVGEYIAWSVDLDLGGPIRLGFARHYGGFMGQAAAFWGFYGAFDSPMGANWSHNFHLMMLRVNSAKVALYYRRGMIIVFDKVAGAWVRVPPPVGTTYEGVPYQLVENGTKLELMDPSNGRIHTFEFATLADFDIAAVESIRDRSGNTLTLLYNPDGTLDEVSDGLGRTLRFTYMTSGFDPRIASVTDPSGRSVTYDYTDGMLTSAIDAEGNASLYAYDGSRRILSVTRPRGNTVVQNTYASNGRIATQTDGLGHTTTFTYAAGRTTITDPLGHTRVHHFDDPLRMSAFTDEAGATIQFAYDDNHRLVSMTDRRGDVCSMTYDASSGYVASRTDNEGSTWTYTYTPQSQEGFTFYPLTRIGYPDGTTADLARDPAGNVTVVTDREGNTTTFFYNGRGQVTTVNNAAGGSTTFAWNPDGTLSSRLDYGGQTTTFDHDAILRPVAMHRSDGTTVQVAYDPNDRVVSITDEAGASTGFTYDANGRLVTLVDRLGHQETFTYDANDDLVSVTDPTGQVTTYAYDPLRRVSEHVDPRGNTTAYIYDARRRLASRTDAGGETWTYGYDDEGVLTSMTGPLGHAYTVFSDRIGRFTGIQDPLGYGTEYVYDALSRLRQVTDALGRTTVYTRDGNGLVTHYATPEPGVSAGYARNSLRRIESVTDPLGHLWTAGYDSYGRRVSWSDPIGNAIGFAYDSRDRLQQCALPGGLGSIDYAYDAAGRRTQWSASDGTVLNYTYDAEGRLLSAEGIALAYSPRNEIRSSNGIEMTYDAAGNMTSQILEPGRTVSYSYDARDRLVGVSDWVGGTTTLAYDDDGRLTSVEHANGIVTRYTYDDADRLLGIAEEGTAEVLSSIALLRDGFGQIVQAIRNTPLQGTPALGVATRSYGAANRVEGHSYDALGRLLDDGERTCSWNLANHLTATAEGGSEVVLQRDALGNILSRTEGGTTTGFVWNHALALPSIVVETEGGTPRRYFVHTPAGQLLYFIDATDGTRVTYHFDEMGSTTFLSDGDGDILQSYAYAPYGTILAEAGNVENGFTYHGRSGVLRDGTLYSMRARHYDPAWGRFLSRDPVEPVDPFGINPYAAFFGNPLGHADPRGTSPEDAPDFADDFRHEAVRAMDRATIVDDPCWNRRLRDLDEATDRERDTRIREQQRAWTTLREVEKRTREADRSLRDAERAEQLAREAAIVETSQRRTREETAARWVSYFFDQHGEWKVVDCAPPPSWNPRQTGPDPRPLHKGEKTPIEEIKEQIRGAFETARALERFMRQGLPDPRTQSESDPDLNRATLGEIEEEIL